jgi:flagellar hook-associated protein 1 FlgK
VTTLSQIAYSGVRASQIALSTTGQNIANVNTPGFSRLQAQNGSLAGESALNAGGGVEVNSIRRLADDFLNQQLWRANTAESFHSTKAQYHSSLEVLMAAEGSSISVGLDQFFASLSEASASPSSIALRQQVINEAGNLAQRFNVLNSNISAQLTSLNEQRGAMVTEVNGLSANIAKLNQQIIETESVKGDTTALRDQRDSLVQSLSGFSSLRINETPDGGLDVSLANGQPLVSGKSAGQLQVKVDADGVQEIQLSFVGTRFPLRQDNLGGAIGALHEVEHAALRVAQGAIKEMAKGLSDSFNAQLTAGSFDLDGNPGQALFTFDPGSTTSMLKTTDLSPGQLGFSDTAGEVGNNQGLIKLLGLKNQDITVSGSNVPMHDAYAGLLGQVASLSRQSQADRTSATSVLNQAQAQRDTVSAVSLDEEAVNLMTYQQAYQANMKVISTANQLFDAMLAAF